jgi:hypothetical protein
MVRGWVRVNLGDLGCLSGIFLNSSRHLSQIPQQRQKMQQFANMATRYKLECLRTLNQAITSSAGRMRFSDALIAETVVLALDEVSVRLFIIFRIGGGLRR